MNQRLHQWAYSKFEHMLTYKAQLRGMTVERASEAYTSQTCPNCEYRHKPSGRDFDCPQCQFSGHRDVVGARNILNKRYPGNEPTGSTQVVGEGPKRSVMASPTGIRYRPNMQCTPATVGKTCTEPRGSHRQAGRPVGSGQRSP
jgi:putative transposase